MTETSYQQRKRRDRERAALIERDGNRCGICGRGPKTRALHVDHDHRTGGVRGLLCHNCNRRLWPGATPAWCLRAAAYLTRANGGELNVGGGSSGL